MVRDGMEYGWEGTETGGNPGGTGGWMGHGRMADRNVTGKFIDGGRHWQNHHNPTKVIIWDGRLGQGSVRQRGC